MNSSNPAAILLRDPLTLTLLLAYGATINLFYHLEVWIPSILPNHFVLLFTTV